MKNKLLCMLFITCVNCVILKETSGRLRGQTSETGLKIQQRYRLKNRQHDTWSVRKQESVQFDASQWNNFNEFRKVMAGELNIDDDMLLTPELMAWFYNEYPLQGKEFDAQNDEPIPPIRPEWATIWCDYCQNQRNCTCVKQFCFNSDVCP